MKREYIINDDTIVVMSVDKNNTVIYEKDDNFKIALPALTLINNSCMYYGSSLRGRIDSSKYYLDSGYKLPIIVDENSEVVFFPIKSYRSSINSFINISKISDFMKFDDGIVLLVENNKEIYINEPYDVFQKQYLKAQKLLMKIRRKKNALN